MSFTGKPNSFEKIAIDNPSAENGGHYKPKYCIATSKVSCFFAFSFIYFA